MRSLATFEIELDSKGQSGPHRPRFLPAPSWSTTKWYFTQGICISSRAVLHKAHLLPKRSAMASRNIFDAMTVVLSNPENSDVSNSDCDSVCPSSLNLVSLMRYCQTRRSRLMSMKQKMEPSGQVSQQTVHALMLETLSTGRSIKS